MRNNLPVSDVEYIVPEEVVLVSKTDLRGIITYCNKAFEEVSGFLEEELLGESHNIVRHPDMPQRIFAHVWETIESGASWHGIIKNRRKNGDYYWVDANISPVFENGKKMGYVSLRYKSTTEQIARAEKLFQSIRNGRLLPLFAAKPDKQYIIKLQQRLAEKIVAQESYLDSREQEQRIAVGYMNRLVALDNLHDRACQFFLKPADNFSGDLIAMARTPDDRLHLLLADSTGHGLAAALAAMPIIHPFYAMTKNGFNISAIAKEINHKVFQVLPISHFVAVTMVAIDPKTGMVEVWCGGCPPPLIFDGTGECVHRFKSRHLAMGILPQQDFDASVEYFSYDGEGYSVLMFSDGAIELENELGELFGMERLIGAAQTGVAQTRMQNIVDALNAHCTEKICASDDIAIVLAQCEVTGKLAMRPKGRQLQQGKELIVWQFVLTLDIRQIKQLDVVPLLLDIVQQVGKEHKQSGTVFMILSELFNNALDHGVLKLDSSLKQHEDGLERYFTERAKRLAEAEDGNIQLSLKKVLNEEGGGSFLLIRVKDSGDGFDHQHWQTPQALDIRPHGRGISLLYGLCRTVQFIGSGAEVLVRFDLVEETRK